jgi:Putative Actinobacterial Holin-X, holin superfamily III
MFFRRKHDNSASLVQLGKSLVSDALRLVRVEIDLLKARFSRTVKQAGIAVGILFAAAFVVGLGAVGLLVAAGLGLAVVLPAWAAALIVAGALLVAGSAAGAFGVKQLRGAMQARTHGPPDIETELQETRYRLEAELEALTTKLYPRHRSHSVETAPAGSNGHAQPLRTPR